MDCDIAQLQEPPQRFLVYFKAEVLIAVGNFIKLKMPVDISVNQIRMTY